MTQTIAALSLKGGVGKTGRGGDVTYHGPGQVVIYLLMDLRRNKPGGKLYARQFVQKIEQAVIDVLEAYNLAGERVAGAPGATPG